MSGFKGLIGTARAVLRRHRDVLPLARRLRAILRSEGLAGIAARLQVLLTGVTGRSPGGLEPGRAQAREQAPPTDDGSGDAGRPRAVARSHTAVRADLLPGALLVGHPYGVLGRSEDIRTAANAFAAAAIPFSLRNTWGDYGREDAVRHKDFRFMDRIGTSNLHKANVFFLNADEMDNAHAYLGSDFFAGRYNIGYWAWELSRFPDEWRGAFRYLDEIWAPSRFIQQAVAEKADCPVLWMPLAVELADSVRLTRRDFDLPEGSFLFLFFFDFRSYVGRKNPAAAIRAFLQAFGQAPSHDVRLVIKMNGTDACLDDYRAFRESEGAGDPRIVLLDRVLDDREIKELVRLCDCFVSLHRSEGFGRGLAEAMFLAKPVIATGYSGNLDFTNALNACLVDYVLVPVQEGEYPYGSGQLWADPDTEQAAWHMRRLVDDPTYAAEIGACAERYIKTYHSFGAIGTRYRRRLERLGLLA